MYRATIDGDFRCEVGDVLHRDDGLPAMVVRGGTLGYWENDVRHRDVAAAWIRRDGSCEYWRRGVLHCTWGPAIVYVNNTCAPMFARRSEYWIDGERLSRAEFYRRTGLNDDVD